ncbi:MAG TPA: hypothetical protein VEC39_11595 [Vicinamibacterales bacterium]|nr:hypothetical protein [Vicinamibacterales bacterium]
MRTRLLTATIGAMTITTALTLSAQTPQNPPSSPQSQPQTQPPADRQRPATDAQRPTDTQRSGATPAQNAQTLTVTGCLRAEKDVPGRTPNVAERAGVGEDYILTNAKMGQGSATSGIGVASMYEIEGISDTELKKHLNHQVEIVGRLGGVAGATGAGSTAGTAMGTTGSTTGTTGSTTGTTGTAGRPGSSGAAGTRGAGTSMNVGNDLPELTATSIRMIAPSCQQK